jgi:hypothetical protein
MLAFLKSFLGKATNPCPMRYIANIKPQQYANAITVAFSEPNEAVCVMKT